MAPVRARRALLYVGGSALTREAMRLALVRFGLQVTEAATVPTAVDRLARSTTDAVLLDDEGLEDDEVVDAVPVLRQASRSPVGIISADPSPILSAGVIRAGATAFLTKHTSLAEFRYSMERLLQGQLVVDPVVARSLMSILGPDNDLASVTGPPVRARPSDADRKAGAQSRRRWLPQQADRHRVGAVALDDQEPPRPHQGETRRDRQGACRRHRAASRIARLTLRSPRSSS